MKIYGQGSGRMRKNEQGSGRMRNNEQGSA